MVFKLFGIGKDIRDARHDPSGFMAEKVVDVVRGAFIIWGIVILLPFIPLITFGFTQTWGGPYLWMRPVTYIWAIIVLIVFLVMRFVIKLLKKKTRQVSDHVVDSITTMTKESFHEKG
jgi:uncharacterized membrane protein